MKCHYVKDIYPLFVENELSQETRADVLRHLQECEECRTVFEGEIGFDDLLAREARRAPSQNLDTKIKRHVKYRRVRSVALLLALILIFSLYNSFSLRHNNIYQHVIQMDQNILNLCQLFGYRPEEWRGVAFPSKLITAHQVHSENLYRNASWLEKRDLQPQDLLLGPEFNLLLYMMELRDYLGNLSSQDEQVLDTLQQYIGELRNELWAYRKDYAGIFSRLDFSRLTELIGRINRLSAHYVLYNQLEAQEFTAEAAAETLRQTLGLSQYELKNPRRNASQWSRMPLYEFDLMDGTEPVGVVQADIFTGQIHSFRAAAEPTRQGKSLPVEEAEAYLGEFLSDSIYDFDIEYLGVNRNWYFDPVGPVLYTFRAMPVSSGFKFYNCFLFYVDARTLNISGLAREDFCDSMYLPLPVPDFEAVFDPEQALLLLEPGRTEGFSYRETLVYRSLLSGKFEVMHSYGRSEEGRPGLYINAGTGKEDKPAHDLVYWTVLMQEYGPNIRP